jgi:hypothetical protein
MVAQENKFKEAIRYYDPIVKKHADAILDVTAIVLANLCVHLPPPPVVAPAAAAASSRRRRVLVRRRVLARRATLLRARRFFAPAHIARRHLCGLWA